MTIFSIYVLSCILSAVLFAIGFIKIIAKVCDDYEYEMKFMKARHLSSKPNYLTLFESILKIGIILALPVINILFGFIITNESFTEPLVEEVETSLHRQFHAFFEKDSSLEDAYEDFCQAIEQSIDDFVTKM